MKRLFAAVGTLGLAVGVGVAGDPPAADPPSVLAARLGSEDFRDGESAEAGLEKAGAAALPALREAVKSSDPEVRQRAAALLTKLQRAADSVGRVAPRKVVLSYKNTPLGTAIND